AGEHHDLQDASLPQSAHGGSGLRTDRVGNGDEAADVVRGPYHHDRPAALRHHLDQVVDLRGLLTALLQIPLRAEPVDFALNAPDRAFDLQDLKVKGAIGRIQRKVYWLGSR